MKVKELKNMFDVIQMKLVLDRVMEVRYSIRFGKRSRLGQRHDFQSTTLTSYSY
jgi:hypothetical protein